MAKVPIFEVDLGVSKNKNSLDFRIKKYQEKSVADDLKKGAK